MEQIGFVAGLGLIRILAIGTLPAFRTQLAVDFAGRHRYRAADLALDDFDDFGELVSRHIATKQRFVAHHDRVDVAVLAQEVESRSDFSDIAAIAWNVEHLDRFPFPATLAVPFAGAAS